MNRKWDTRFLNLARQIGTWSKDPSSKIGSLLVRDRIILGTGYNGFPKGIEDKKKRLDDRETKYKYMIHAEMNCLYNSGHNDIMGSTLYVSGLPVCSECAKGVIQKGISTVVMEYSPKIADKWKDSFALTSSMFDEAGIRYYSYVDLD